MLDQTKTRILDMFEMDLLSTVTVDQEGVALQLALENGIGKVRPTNGTANTIFAGILWGDRFAPPAAVPFVETGVVAAGKLTLSKTPTAEGEILVIKGTDYTGTVLANSASPTASQWDLDVDGKTILTNTANNDSTLFVVYRYALTVAEAQIRYGDAYPGPRAMNAVKKVGIIKKGFVYTDRFDPAVNWHSIDTVASAEIIVGIANGMFSVNQTGTQTTGQVHVVEAPSVGSPFLGLYVDC